MESTRVATPLLNVPLPDPGRLPERLSSVISWLPWRAESREEKNGKLDKIPCDRVTGRNRDMNDRSNWSTFDEAFRAVHRLRERCGSHFGVGFVFYDSIGLTGADLDDAIRDGIYSERLQYIIDKYPTWGEKSVSGCGAHLFYEGTFDNVTRNHSWRGGKIEIFTKSGFLAMTGTVLTGTPLEIGNGEPLIAEITKSTEQQERKHEVRNITLSTNEVIKRAIDYLGKCPPSISGQGGHAAAMWAARVVVRGFNLGPDAGFWLLRDHWNQSCQPPWSEKELHHKCQEAYEKPFDKPRGWLMQSDRNGFYNGKYGPHEDRISQGIQRVTNAIPLGDAHEGPKPETKFKFINSAIFSSGDYRPNWLIPKILVRGAPGIIAGPAKSLKTSLLIDMAVSLAGGVPFLGEFPIHKPVRVAVASGESGEHTLQETALRIARARGVNLAELDESLQWCFKPPTISDVDQVEDFAIILKELKVEVVLIDPLYLCLGQVDPKDMFAMGSALQMMTMFILEAGATPIIAHHANRQLLIGEPMELIHLAYAGLEQYARQFILINRRERYTSNGVHNFWVRVGGSIGHGCLLEVRIDEGQLDEDFGGRKWDLAINSAADAFAQETTEREQAKAEANREKWKLYDAEVLKAIDVEISRGHLGATKSAIRQHTAYQTPRVNDCIARLSDDGIIEEVSFEKTNASGAKHKCKGFRRVVRG